MILIPVGQVVTFANFALETLRSQIDILDALGYSQQRGAFIERLKAQADYLSKKIEDAENSFIDSIEKISTAIIDSTASVRDEFKTKANHSIHDAEMNELADVMSEFHSNTVKDLGAQEQKAVTEILEQFADVKNKTHRLLVQIENLRM